MFRIFRKMVLCKVLWLCGVIVLIIIDCDSQFLEPGFDRYNSVSVPKPIPFPTCRMDDIECLRRGLRTFFFLMDAGHLGMKPVDPTIINSISVALPEQQMSFLLRNINVTGARWSKLIDRKFSLSGIGSTALFSSDLHVTGDIIITSAERLDPLTAFLTMDIQAVQTNITYSWIAQRGVDNYDYIILGNERIVVRNSRTPTFFVQPDTDPARAIDKTLQAMPSILDHLSDEITNAVMHVIFDNIKLFSRTVPIHHYYKLYKK